MAQISEFVWIDGKFVKWGDAKIHIVNHSLLYGDAVFEGIRSYKTDNGTAIFRLDEHIGRLFFSARSFDMKIDFKKNELKNTIKRLLDINGLGDAYIRPIAYFLYFGLIIFP